MATTAAAIRSKVLETEDLSVGQLLQGRYPLMVPAYQRAYAWDDEELDYFCSDLKDVYTGRRTGASGYHFFGAMVTVKIGQMGTPGWNDTYEVVDGQQRLATFGILVAVLVSELKWLASEAQAANDSAAAEEAKSHEEMIVDQCLRFKAIIAGKRQTFYRIGLSGVDKDVYESILEDPNVTPQTDPARESHRLLVNACSTIKKFVQGFSRTAGLSLQQRLEQLVDLESAFLDHCLMIHMITLERQSAKKLFSVINNRGKSLTAGDLLRSSTLELVETSEPATKRVEKAWDNILVDKPSRVEDFLMTLHTSYEGKRPRKYALFEDFRLAYFPDGKSPREYADSAERLQKELNLYRTLEQGEWPYIIADPKVKDWDRARLKHVLKTLDNTLCLSILMAAATQLNEATFARIVHLVERVTFRYVTMAGSHVTPLGELYGRHAKRIRIQKQNYQVSDLVTDLQSLLNKRVPDAVFKDEMRAKLVYARDKNLNIRYFLAMLEYYWDFCVGSSTQRSADKTFSLNLDELTIEHIYPQKPTVKEVSLDPVVNYLGNLTILAPGENTKLGNQDFPAKQLAYQQARYKINQALGAVPQWSVVEYEARMATLLDYGVRIFSPF